MFRHTLVDGLDPAGKSACTAPSPRPSNVAPRRPIATTATTLARHYLRSAAIPGAERGVPYAVAVADDAAARYARHEELIALRGAAQLLEEGDDRVVAVRCGFAQAAVLAQVDPETVLADAEAAALGLAETAGDDEAADLSPASWIERCCSRTSPCAGVSHDWPGAGSIRNGVISSGRWCVRPSWKSVTFTIR